MSLSNVKCESSSSSSEPTTYPINPPPKKNVEHADPRFRDPRFDPRCSGSNDFRHFVKNYQFLDEIRGTEISQLERASKRETNQEKRVKIRQTISKLKNKIVENKNKARKLEAGGNKKKLLVDKYKELKDSGKLSKYLERKRKKLIKRDIKRFS